MKFDPKTLRILKSFTDINKSIVFDQGTVLSVRSPSRTILGFADIPDTIPKRFGIYDVTKLLSVLSLFSEPDIQFEDKYLLVGQGRNVIRYWYTDPDNIVDREKPIPTREKIRMPEALVQFELSEEVYGQIIKAMNILGAPNVVIQGSDGKLSIVARNIAEETSNSFAVDIGDTEKEFSVVFSAEQLKFISTNYNVTVSSAVSHFKAEDIQYYIAADAKKKR